MMRRRITILLIDSASLPTSSFMQYNNGENYVDAYQEFYAQFINSDDESEELEEEPEEAVLTEN